MANKAPTPPSGTRDFLPSVLIKRKYVIDIISKVYEQSGFEPLETPAMEKLSVLTGKYGEEGEQLIFKVLKRGEKLKKSLKKENIQENDLAETGLRYDLTIPLSRVMALYSEQLGSIFKRYQIQPVWRADRPAKGRFREFYQCDVDILGSSEILAELQIFEVIERIMTNLGFSEFKLHLNHRTLLSSLLNSYQIEPKFHSEVLIALDKADKIGLNGVLNELEKSEGVNKNALSKLSDLIELSLKSTDNKQILDFISKQISTDKQGILAVEQLIKIFEYSNMASKGHLVFNPILARGLNYYTGSIFELRIPNISSSIGGGGRYDKLIGMFSGRDIPSVGFSFGLERIIDIMEEQNMFPQKETSIDITIGVLQEEYVTRALKIQSDLSKTGIKTDLFPKVTKPSKIFKWASKKGIKYVALIGEEEFSKNIISVKNLITGENHKIITSDFTNFFKNEK